MVWRVPIPGNASYDQCMSENAVEERTCRYPGCNLPAEAPDADTGRPPGYCADPGHNPSAAYRARKRLGTADAGAGESRPVDAARQRASEITGQVTGMMEHLGAQLLSLVEEIRTIGDTTAAEVQIEAVNTEAAEMVATAAARASRAEQAQRRAEAERDEADTAATDAIRQNEELTKDIETVRADLAETRERAADAARDLDAAEAEITRLRSELEAANDLQQQTAEERDVLASRLESETQARAAADEKADAEAARAARSETTSQELRTQLEGTQIELERTHEVVAELSGSVASLTVERDAARADIERERIHGEQRVEDLRTTYDRQIDQLREDLARDRQEIRELRTRPRNEDL